MRIACFDCFAGISGDMVLGAFLDAGFSLPRLEEELGKLNLKGYRLKAERVKKHFLTGTRFKVELEGEKKGRSYREIKELIKGSELGKRVKERSLAVFERLAEAEGRIHGQKKEEVAFHEVGATDSIVDTVGAAIVLEEMGIEEVYSSIPHLGSGFVTCSHGRLPLPSPATLEVLKGVPVILEEVEGERVTPTGAAILSVLTHRFGDIPPIKIEKIGYGAGERDFQHFPNLLRVIIGESKEPFVTEEISLLETNIDDLNPQLYQHLQEELLSRGALDVYLTPVQMKKSRPGVLLTVLAQPGDEDSLCTLIFRETSTLGIRVRRVKRKKISRRTVEVNTPYGKVKVKVGEWEGKVMNISPEYEDCREIARAHHLPLKKVMELAKAAYYRKERD